MEYRSTVLGIILSLSLTLCVAIEEASFYGNSYISLSFKEAKSSTDIRFKFKTYLSNALLLLVAGSTDYCIVRLENSRLKININLGAGESELISQNSVKVNDFKWHEVSIIRRDSDLSMIIDRAHRVQTHLPGRFFELNIHYGLFVGGHGNFSEIFFGHLDKYRGCLSELEYNGIMVLETARLRKSQSIVRGVTWNCATEFAASVTHPISFVEDDAYMVVPQASPHKEFEIQFEIKTISPQGLLFYNSGNPTKPDFFIIDVWKSNIRCLIRVNEKLLSLVNDEYVSDGNWHKVYFHLFASLAEIIVDGKIKQEKNKHSQVFEFSDSSYIGGLEISKRSRAMSKGCQFCDTSFKGCIRNLAVSGRQTGLPDVHVSEGLLPGCMWHYPCLKNPCKTDRVCLQQGLNSFTCECQDDLCTQSNYTEGYKVFSQNSLATDLELLSVEPLTVLEGQSEIISTNNLYMILDYQKYGVKESGIHFYITEGPAFGNIVIDMWPHEKNMFTLADVAVDKVHYIHDGSENHADYVMLDIEFSPIEPFILPIYLQGRFRFTLSITVIPVNDPPTLNIPNTSVLRMVQGTKITVGSDLLHAEDPDNSPDQLIFNVIKANAGHFEYAKKSGSRINSFTQEEIDNNEVIFIHHDDDMDDSYVTFQVSDGIEMGTLAKLRISVSPEYWRLENNTGLVLLHQTSAVVTPNNLSFISNVPNVDYKLQFYIVKKPHFGAVEIEKNINIWEASDTFTSSDLMQHRVRYHHLKSKPDFDEFQFRTSFNKSAVFTFRLTFAKCRLYSTRSNKMLMNETWETTITDQHVFFKTKPISTTTLTYVIIEPPKYGYLFSSVSKYHLKSCDVFTQEDILLKNVKYKFFQKPYSVIEDYFTFIVLSPGCSNKTENFSISYYPPDILKSKIQVVLAPLHIREGAYASIDSKHLFITGEFLSDLNFNITKKASHGMLQVVSNNVTNHDVSHFTLSDIKNGNLLYIHDDSETTEDFFIFVALSREDDRFQYVGTFQIEVQLKNDNTLVRSVDRVFHVVVGGERLLTSEYLKYTDADIDTKPSDIVYTYRETANGNFYNIQNPSTKISEFTQEDIDNNKVLFKHKGPEYAKVRLWVTDGQFHVNGNLEIQASAPFIHLLTNSKLIVQQGKMAAFFTNHLSYSTNLFTFSENVIYEVVTKPTFGKVVNSKTLKVVHNFTHADIEMGHISYFNDIPSGNADEIGVRIRCKDAVDVAQLSILILPSSYWKPLHLRKIDTLSVEESTSALITKSILEVIQENIPSSSITYYVHKAPKNGYLALLSNTESSSDEPSVTSLTQNLINEDRVLYIQSGANQTKDRIIFNVTNGIVWYNDLELQIQIIPEHLYLGSNNLTVNEGDVATLTSNHLFVSTDFYKFKVTDYVILQDAEHGCIQIQEKCNKFSGFSQKDLSSGLVRYSHDDSEDSTDEITVVAIAGNKRSIPTTVWINILPVNDHEPRIKNNTGLLMWEGGFAVVSNEMLAAIDDDKPPEKLAYEIHGCWQGSLILASNMSRTITRFTQDSIDNRLIAFKHHNGTKAKFIFVVTDGQHTSKEHTFHIRTKPVHLKLYKNSLQIFPLQKKYLTSEYLLSQVSDPHRIIIYEIVKPPTLGRLMMEFKTAGIFSVASSFTQEDINASRIFYEHTHQFTDFYANDSFTFNVKSHLAQTIFNEVFKIDVSISSGGLDSYIAIPKISVNEGGTTNISVNLSGVVSFLENYAGLHSPIIHASATKPQHGQIFLRHKDNLTTFTQSQLESGQVSYEHDHSDTLEDYIYVSLYLLPGYVPLCNISVPIIVNPINDQPFELITQNPSLTVVQGENHTITREELATADKDTPPSLIKYVVISEPTQGKLVLLPEVYLPVLYFTQADIDQNRLVYIHNSSVLSDSFHFRVSDEVFRPLFKIFNINVLPIKINVSAGLPVYLKQGSDMVLLTEKQFHIKTNSNLEKITYIVIKEPKHGVLYVRNTPSSSFTHSDLKSDSIMYLQTDMTAANDSFRVQAEMMSGNTSVGNSVHIQIKVQPLMHLRNFTAVAGEKTKITLHVMDATPLAKLTDSNPRYTIVNMTKYFQVRKIIRSSGERKSVLDIIVNTFSHEEIQSGLINLAVADDGLHSECQGYIWFFVSASIFQPAFGELIVHVKVLPVNEIHSTLAGPSDPAGHEGGFNFTGPSMTKDYFLIVSMVFGIIVLGVTVIIIIKCRSLESDELNKQDQCLQSMPLSHPTDSLISPPQPLLKHIDGYNSSIPATLPQCKVTPLSKNESETHTLYPYGAEDHQEDWSSCEASEPQCPSKSIMLRRNQYWV